MWKSQMFPQCSQHLWAEWGKAMSVKSNVGQAPLHLWMETSHIALLWTTPEARRLVRQWLLREESFGDLREEEWEAGRKLAFNLTLPWPGVSFRHLFGPHTDPWPRWCHPCFENTETKVQRATHLGSGQDGSWTQAHVSSLPRKRAVFMQQTLELGCRSFSLKIVDKLLNFSVPQFFHLKFG